MNWQQIKSSLDNRSFIFEGQMLFDREFIEVLNFHSPGIAAVRDESGAYHINSQGKPLYIKRFVRSFGFYNGRAAVSDLDGWKHIDEYGEEVYVHRFSWVGNYQENICPVRLQTGNYIHIDLEGNQIGDEEYLYCGDFKDGVASVQLCSGKYRHILTNGKPLHEKTYLELGIYHKCYATARDERGWCHIDKCGLPLYANRYWAVEPFYNGLARVRDMNGNLLVINEQGLRI